MLMLGILASFVAVFLETKGCSFEATPSMVVRKLLVTTVSSWVKSLWFQMLQSGLSKRFVAPSVLHLLSGAFVASFRFD